MSPGYKEPFNNKKGKSPFLHTDAQRQLEDNEVKKFNKNAPTYIEKDGKIIPIDLKVYNAVAEKRNEEIRRTKEELDELLRNNRDKNI